MSWATVIYLASILNGLEGIFIVGVAIGIATAFCSAIWWGYLEDEWEDGKDHHQKRAMTWIIRSVVCAIICSLLLIFTPDKKTFLAMVVVHEVETSETVLQLGEKSFDVLDAKLDKMLEGQDK